MHGPAALGAWRGRARRGRRPPAGVAGTLGALALGAIVTTRALAPTPSPRPPPAPVAPVVVDTGIVAFGGRRMSVGMPGDVVTIGRWNCASASVALLRPATGEVFRFEGWASAGRAVDALPVGKVEEAVAIHPVAGARPGCDDIAVARAAGPPVVVWRAP